MSARPPPYTPEYMASAAPPPTAPPPAYSKSSAMALGGKVRVRFSRFDRVAYVLNALLCVVTIVKIATSSSDTDAGALPARLLLTALVPANLMSAFTKPQSRAVYFDLALFAVVANNGLALWTLLAALFKPEWGFFTVHDGQERWLGSLNSWVAVWQLNVVHILSLFIPLRNLRAQGAKPGVVLWALCFGQSVLFYASGVSASVNLGAGFVWKMAFLAMYAINANCFLLSLDVACVYANIGLSTIAVLTLVRVLPSISRSSDVFTACGIVWWLVSLLFWLLVARYGHLVSPKFEPPVGARVRVRAN